MSPDIPYEGTELEIFADATTWKRYWQSVIVPFLRGDVLEVGPGIGASMPFLLTKRVRRLVGLEPDRILCERATHRLQELGLHDVCRMIHGTVFDLPPGESFDAIVYLDVLEHIADDVGELDRSTMHLRPGGVLIILVPAHSWLYTEFDRAIGHVRRYTKATLRRIVPPGLKEEVLVYLDSVGMIASGLNRLLLRQGEPSRPQIRFWDRVLVRLSRVTDPLLGYSVGKSALGVWRKASRD